MAHGTGTAHHKLHSWVGYGLIIGLPFAICSAICAIRMGTAEAPSAGFINWLSTPVYAAGFFAFFTAALWYAKLEFDEVVMDYFDGGLRSFSLLANRAVSLIVWVTMAATIAKLAF